MKSLRLFIAVLLIGLAVSASAQDSNTTGLKRADGGDEKPTKVASRANNASRSNDLSAGKATTPTKPDAPQATKPDAPQDRPQAAKPASQPARPQAAKPASQLTRPVARRLPLVVSPTASSRSTRSRSPAMPICSG